jgi:hypothetical protein
MKNGGAATTSCDRCKQQFLFALEAERLVVRNRLKKLGFDVDGVLLCTPCAGELLAELRRRPRRPSEASC